MANIKQAQQMIPLITREISFGQNVSELGFGADVFVLVFGVQVDSIEQPIKRNSVGPGNMSHCGTPSLHDHLDHCFVVLKHIQQSFLMRKSDVRGNTINVIQHVGLHLRSLTCVRDNGSPRSLRSLNRVSIPGVQMLRKRSDQDDLISASTERKLPTTIIMSNLWNVSLQQATSKWDDDRAWSSQEWKTDTEMYERSVRPDETSWRATRETGPGSSHEEIHHDGTA